MAYRGGPVDHWSKKQPMANVPMYDIVFFFAVVPALCAVLVIVLSTELRRIRRTVNETNGLYKVMLDHVLETYGPSDDGDDARS